MIPLCVKPRSIAGTARALRGQTRDMARQLTPRVLTDAEVILLI
jgi:hypothetical protein